ncbi:MAG: ABC transporter substrate-binding protein [Pseudomonadota bacterium]
MRFFKLALPALAGAALAFGGIGQQAEAGSHASPKRGGTLTFVVGSKIPSYDGHVETTFGMIHPIAPFYSLLIRVDPTAPASNKFECDVCEGDVPAPTENGTKFTFKIRDGLKFHNGDPLTAADVVATYQKIIFPPKGTASSRKAFYSMVDSVTAPDDKTVVFKLKFASGAFIPALASPFNFIYSDEDLKKNGMQWHKTNINGSGPFVFVEHQPGAFVSGKRFDGYHFKGRPYVDGFKAIAAPKMSARVQAIEGDRASIEFRGFPPKQRDALVKVLGDKIKVQESDWNCVLLATPNQRRKPFDDPRVRRALSLAVDRWGGSKYLSRIAIVKTVGGVVFPGHPLAATEEELTKLAGYGRDMGKNRAEAKRLLAEAGVKNLKVVLNNRGVDQPYKVVGTWLVDQWRRIGLNVTQKVNPSPVFYDILRKKYDFDVSIDFNCQSVINPIADVTKFLPGSGNNYSGSNDQQLKDIYAKLLRAPDEASQRTLMRQFEKRALVDHASHAITLWWYKINPHRSYVKGWKIAPSHYLGQQLDQVWLDQ